MKRIREQLRVEMRALRGANASAVPQTIDPIVRGWSAYYRTVVSSATFHALDRYMWALTYKWATYSHQNKPKSWIIAQYYGQFDPARQDRWVFGDHASGTYLQPSLRMLKAQDGRGPICKEFLLHASHEPQSPREWEQWLAVTAKR